MMMPATGARPAQGKQQAALVLKKKAVSTEGYCKASPAAQAAAAPPASHRCHYRTAKND